ncbi:hypothetical protein N9O57_00620 [bacterium]|nr:hypothetical protein [bacterium]
MSEQKLLEKNPMGGIAVPIAIVLVGALVIFGVTKMLSTDRSYKDLVYELESKTFGNRWVAAFELSKVLSNEHNLDEDEKISPQDRAWLVGKLETIYFSASDPRTKEFIVVALGSLGEKSSLGVHLDALNSDSKERQFHALVAISRSKIDESFDWQEVYKLLDSDDKGLVQSAIFTIATQKAPGASARLARFLSSENLNLKYSAAVALLLYKNEKALEVSKEILSLPLENRFYDPNKTRALKFNVLNALQTNPWDKLAELIEERALKDSDIKVVSRANQVLKVLKD